MVGVGFRLEAGLHLGPFFRFVFEVENDACARPVRRLVGARKDVSHGFRYCGLPRCPAYCEG
jgi:hypothetical protein